MTKNDLTVIGHTAFDYILSVDRFPSPNESTNVNSLETFDGGSAGNVSVVGATLGLKVSLLSAVGYEFRNSKYEKRLLDLEINLDDMIIVKNKKTPIAFMLTDPDENQVFYFYLGAGAAFLETEVPKKTIKNCEILHLSTGNPNFNLRGSEVGRSLDKIVSFDPGQDLHLYSNEDLKSTIERTNILFGNHHEIDSILNKLKLDVDGLKGLGPDLVVKTCGRFGSIIYANEKIKIDPIYRPAIDPTGAGDSYRAGFFKYYLEDKPLEECAKFASAVSSFIVEKEGCQTNIPTLEEVKNRMNEFQG
ncbi:MAG: carbohydrate kinase family protein [Methanobrevibacter sp.]|jgi:ribokinase|nr:carbohydrate kinase family protein [Candidatus Methanovirga aequatorialis]